MKVKSILSALVLGASTLLASPSQAAITCSCEHLNSVWDGLCEAQPGQQSWELFSGFMFYRYRYTWTTTGSATMPQGSNSLSEFGYYTVPAFQSGTLRVSIRDVYKGVELGSKTCAFGT